MTNQQIINVTAAHIREKFLGEGSGHDWWHIYRVWQTALHIAGVEDADLYIVQLGALLHDIADWKFHDGDDRIGSTQARAWLTAQGADNATIDHVVGIVDHISFKGAGVATPMPTLEGQIVQDADRLDAIGAIGIARAFAYGGAKSRVMHDPDTAPVQHESFAAYKTAHGTTINHFYEKLLLLKDRMNTAEGRRMAEARHAFMEGFLNQFHAEWEGER
jgi:uncharacterized protein